ncbi:MAG: hypothetical protein EOP60_12410 [Sphingomonadales bacterium]|nr:MAG: hypothetical protein EOP60_12410 [Sphingomonadales bacterium]
MASVATNIPQWSGGGAYEWKVAGFKSGMGQWKLSSPVGTDGWGWAVDFSSKTIKLPNNDGPGGFLLGEKPPYKLLLNLARDPDQDEAMTFEKQTP